MKETIIKITDDELGHLNINVNGDMDAFKVFYMLEKFKNLELSKKSGVTIDE